MMIGVPPAHTHIVQNYNCIMRFADSLQNEIKEKQAKLNVNAKMMVSTLLLSNEHTLH